MDAPLSIAATLNLSPPPSFSRLPPDGHEFPPNYQEPCPDSPSIRKHCAMEATAAIKVQTPPPPLPCTAPPVIKKQFPRTASPPDEVETVRKFSTASVSSVNSDDSMARSPLGRGGCWRNDEKSEKSVRDKIAMFSNVSDETPISPTTQPRAAAVATSTLVRKLNRFKSSEDVFSSNSNADTTSSNSLPSGKLLSRSVMSVDKVVSSPYQTDSANQNCRLTMKKGVSAYNSMVDVSPAGRQSKVSAPNLLEFGSRTQSSMDLTLSSTSSSAYSSCSPESSLSPTVSPSYAGYSSTLPRKHQRETERKTSLTSTQPPSLENKSHTSLSRAVSFTVGSKLHSRSQSLVDVAGSGLNKYVPNSVSKTSTEEARRASLNALIEQRRRSISKLRGLVIPEKVTEVPLVQQTIVDLPEIISKDSVLPAKKNSSSIESRLENFNAYNRIVTNANNISANPSVVVATPTAGLNNNNINNYGKGTTTAPNLMTSPPWKSDADSANDLPKYSPAFKRKSLAVYGISSSASSLSSSLSSSREELRPYFDNNQCNNYSKTSKPPRSAGRNNVNFPAADINLLQNNEPPKSLESITSPTRSDLSFEFISSTASSPDVKMMMGHPHDDPVKVTDFKNNNNIGNEPQVITPLIKTPHGKRESGADAGRSGGEESDNDSAVSSSRSSISHDFSPPPSPLPDGHQRTSSEDGRQHLLLSPSNSASSGDRRTLRRTLSSETTASAASSTGSTLTSGSQASCSSSGSDSMSRRILKAQSVEAINRKNVLSSARFSSGQDLKVGSPLIQRKFENENGIQGDVDTHGETVDDDENHSDSGSFISKLSKTLSKDEVAEEDGTEPNGDREIINYQLSSSDECYPLDSAKVAYLEMEVVDGRPSPDEPNLSSSSPDSSNPPSIDGAGYDYSSDDKALYNDETVNNRDRPDRSKYERREMNGDVYGFQIRNGLGRTRNNELNCGDIVPSKQPLRRSIKEMVNCDSETKVESNQNRIDDSINSSNIRSVDVAPKPTQRKGSLLSSYNGLKKGPQDEESDYGLCVAAKQQEREALAGGGAGRTPTAATRAANSRRSVSVNDIRKAFEKAELAMGNNNTTTITKPAKATPVPVAVNGTNHHHQNNNHHHHSHARVSSLDSTTSEDSCAPTPTHYGSITNLQKEQQFGSITSLASSTSLISQQELQQLIDDANQTLEETGRGSTGCSHEVLVVILHRDTPGGSVGITLAGGADYESKEITVHKVLAGSPADRDGRIQKGDRILSINGKSMKGVTHRESLAILKAPRPEVVLVVSRWRPEGPSEAQEDPLVASLRSNLRHPRIPEQPSDVSTATTPERENVARGPPTTVCLLKDGAGLGFSLEGGKDSPLGDMPLTIKKIFTGGCAEKSGQLFAGDELLLVNGTDVTSMSRIEAWSLMKRLADGKVTLSLRHKTVSA